MPEKDVSVVSTFHDEEYLIGPSIASLIEAVEKASDHNMSVELLFAVDRPTEITKRLVKHYGNEVGARVIEFDLGDQGLVRNACVEQVTGNCVAFLDGDDLFGYDWLWKGKKELDSNDNCIIHPELNIFFEGRQSVFVHKSSNDPYFDYDYFRVGNYWDAMCMSNKDILLSYPYRERNLTLGFAYEDWDWNMRTLADGIDHLVASDTVHFKRARQRSQSKQSRDRGVVFHTNKLSFYESYETL